jgi:hypothetical protein
MWTDEEDEIFDLITELATAMERVYGLPVLDAIGWVDEMQVWRDTIIDPIEDDDGEGSLCPVCRCRHCQCEESSE